jgi:ADP-ribosyl-[dinitrogen reductase] hydrolase
VTLVRMMHILLSGQGKQETRSVAAALVEQHRNFRFEPYPGQSTPYVVDTLQTVLHYYYGTQTFMDCLIQTVNQGGDADTTGALGGMLAGATYGLGAIPDRWLGRLDAGAAGEIRRQVPALLALAGA